MALVVDVWMALVVDVWMALVVDVGMALVAKGYSQKHVGHHHSSVFAEYVFLNFICSGCLREKFKKCQHNLLPLPAPVSN